MPVTSRRVAAIAAALALVATSPTTTLATVDGVKETSRSTFELLPGEGRVHVHSTVKLINQKKPRTSRGPCQSDPRRTCKIKTTYYIDAWGPILVPADAAGLAITGPRVEPFVLRDGIGLTDYAARIPRLQYRKKQRIDVDYDLLDNGPGSPGRTRIAEAYAHFCWNAEYVDRGKAEARLPAGWEAITTDAAVETATTPAGTVIRLANTEQPGALNPCTDAFRTDAIVRSYTLGPSGQVIALETWPDDPAWATAVERLVATDLPVLEELIGSPMPYPTLTITEVARVNGFGRASDLDRSMPRLLLDEDVDFTGAPSAALARTWFDTRAIADPWLIEGLALWAGLTATGSTCPEPGPYPGEGPPTLRQWYVDSNDRAADAALPAWQAMTACSIVEDAATDIGPERMTTVIDSLLRGTPRYGDKADGPGTDKPADWRDWLDAVDELGMVPAAVADLERAQQALLDNGVATPTELAGRTAARRLYHDTKTRLGDTDMPALVDELMGSWSFEEATTAILAAGRIHDVIAAHPTLTDPERHALTTAFEQASSPGALAMIEAAATAWTPSAG